MKIEKLVAREVLNSRGSPTLEVDVITDAGFGRSIAPSGKSTGKREAVELLDGGKRYNGLGVKKAIANVRKLSKQLKGMDPNNQAEIDAVLIKEGGKNKAKIGANVSTAVSLAVCSAAAFGNGQPVYLHLNKKAKRLPVPMLNVINGGKHGGNPLAVQEFMLIPKKFKSFKEALRAGTETYHVLGKMLEKEYGVSATNVGDEGGYAPPLRTTDEALNILEKAIRETGYEKQIYLGMDVAASSFFASMDHYRIDGRMLSARELLRYYQDLIKEYPLISIEDPFEESDLKYMGILTRESQIQIVGDDTFTSRVEYLKEGVQKNSGNAVLLKVNQVGTLTEALQTAEYAKANDWNVIVSHRSGSSEDTFIADLAVALGTGQIKSGAPCRSERTAKYNQLLRIEEELGKKAVFGMK